MKFKYFICKYIAKKNTYKCIGLKKTQKLSDILKILKLRYRNPYTLEYLLSLGALNKLGYSLGNKQQPDTISYRRDLGIPGNKVKAFEIDNLELLKGHVFYWKKGKWYYKP